MFRLLFALCFIWGLLPETAASAECDPSAMVDDCSMNPVSVKYRWLGIGLCKGQPVMPTTTQPLDYSNCELLYDKIDEDGQVIEWEGSGDYGELAEELSIPVDGTYDYFIFGVGVDSWVKFDVEFPVATQAYGNAHSVSSGRYCRTVDASRYAADGEREITVECGAVKSSPEYSLNQIWIAGGVDLQCNSWDGRWIKSDRTLATVFSDAAVYIGVTAIPSVTISSRTSVLAMDWAFDELFRVDVDSAGQPAGWFIPYQVCPSVSVSVQ